MNSNLTTPIITLNVNNPNSPNKKQRFSYWIKKQGAKYMLSIRNTL